MALGSGFGFSRGLGCFGVLGSGLGLSGVGLSDLWTSLGHLLVADVWGRLDELGF